MTSILRGGVSPGKTKGKRKAKEPPSPASSESSDNTIGEAFVAEQEAKQEAKRIKIKQEPIGELTVPSRLASVAEGAETMQSDNLSNRTLSERVDNGLGTPSSTQHAIDSTAGHDPSLHFEASTDLLYILSSCDMSFKRFQRRAEELIEDAFALAPASENEAPGLPYLEWVVEELGVHGATHERKTKVKQRLMEMWRSQMAVYIGRNTFSDNEAEDTVRTLVGALSFQTNRDCAIHPLVAGSCVQGDNPGSGDGVAPLTPKAPPFEFTDDIVREDVHSHGRVGAASFLDTPESANSDDVAKERLHEWVELSDEPPITPVFIPCPTMTNVEVSRRVMFLMNAPDMPRSNISEARMIRACSLAFGTGLAGPQVERLNRHIWIATFQRAEDAEKARGKAIVLNGRSIVAEYVHPKAPHAFSCDFTDIDVSDEEVALQVANAFEGRDKRVELRVQKTKKLYPGRIFLMSVPKSQKLIRFYIPMRMDDSDEIFMACFTPVNPKVPCSFCRDKHRRGEPCEHAEKVPISFGDRSRM